MFGLKHQIVNFQHVMTVRFSVLSPLNPQLFSDICVCKHDLMDSVKGYFPTKVSLTEEVR